MKLVSIIFLSGVDDGISHEFDPLEDGRREANQWTVTIGRREENDLIIKNDAFVSRYHARLHYRNSGWSLEDCQSRNGTYIENDLDPLADSRVIGQIGLTEGQLFRVGRTWLRVEVTD